ncbi:hypothetical protein [Paraburkholderia sp. BL17N1]|uniref:hypothetical protein n=1 Tax=Paraburkholderia sp. BL17N1 TaxID=1938798 RepID=UPI0011C43103|nr:hypothetical protein [Paraburkholderia sp. BL17N1]
MKTIVRKGGVASEKAWGTHTAVYPMGAKSGLADIDTGRPRAIPAQQRRQGKNRANAGNIAEEKEKALFLNARSVQASIAVSWLQSKHADAWIERWTSGSRPWAFESPTVCAGAYRVAAGGGVLFNESETLRFDS